MGGRRGRGKRSGGKRGRREEEQRGKHIKETKEGRKEVTAGERRRDFQIEDRGKR